MQLREIAEAKQTNVKKVADALHGYFRGEVHAAQIETLSICCAYALYKAQQIGGFKLPGIEAVLETMKGDDKVYHLVEPLIKEHWECIGANYRRFPSKSLAAFILFSFNTGKSSTEATPASIVSLSLALLDIRSRERVADFGTGVGTFLVNAFLEKETAVYYGVDHDPSMSMIAGIRAELLGGSIAIKQSDMFTFAELEGPFHKIFSNYPFGIRLKNMHEGLTHLEKLSDAYPNASKITSSDWVFNFLLVSSITNAGKAVGIMTNGSTWNSTDRPIREYFVHEGFIETIVALPEKMFSTTAIPTTLVVFSRKNERIRMIDAREVCQKGRRQNEFSESDISAITSALTEDSEVSKSVDIREIEKNEFALNPTRYLEKLPEIENGTIFDDVIIKIMRGAHLTATQLDEMTSLEPTMVRFLKLSNIQDGFIDEKLPYLKEVDTRYQNYCIRPGNLLISKNGLPVKADVTDVESNKDLRRGAFASFKVAVADIEPNMDVIANSNIYIIRLNESKVDPYYLKAYFESEQGALALNRIAVGATLPVISAEQLRKLIIPMPDLPAQREFVVRYLAQAAEAKRLKHELENAQSVLRNMFEDMKSTPK